MKSDDDMVSAYIEFHSQNRTREFRKYWEHKKTPEDDIIDLIVKNPNRAAVIIDKILRKTDNDYIEDQLVSGLMWEFKHRVGEEYSERLNK